MSTVHAGFMGVVTQAYLFLIGCLIVELTELSLLEAINARSVMCTLGAGDLVALRTGINCLGVALNATNVAHNLIVNGGRLLLELIVFLIFIKEYSGIS